MRHVVAILLWSLIGASLAVAGEPPAWCPPSPELMDRDRYLRSLSLDLRGVAPNADDYEQVESLPDVPEALVDEWLGDIDFAQVVAKRVRATIWGSIANVELVANANRMTAAQMNIDGKSTSVYYRRPKAELIRGERQPCANEALAFTETGAIKTVLDPETGAEQEGWVAGVQPYWLPPGETIVVCGFDALTDAVSIAGTDCATKDAMADPYCGCGPNLRWCRPYKTQAERDLYLQALESMGQAVEKRVEALILEDRPMTDLFFDNRMWVNGPVVHILKHWVGLYQNLSFLPLSLDPGLLPDLDFLDTETWVPVELGPHHAGILSDPLYLVRFQTNRARANRAWNSFLCKPFQPPAGGIDVMAGGTTPDLQERPGCAACHQELEPASSYWGRWPEYAGGYLNPVDFPPVRGDCLECAQSGQLCNAECEQYYLVQVSSVEELPFLGWLKSYVFRYEADHANIEQGPQLMAQRYIQDQRIPRCFIQRTGEWLLGRDFHPREAEWVESLLQSFTASNYSYRSLVKSIVTHSSYRRVQ